MKPLVIYHADCWDGFCAAWVARKQMPDLEAVPAHYGTPAPDVKGRDVYVLDFSYPRPVLLDMLRDATLLVVLDHHKTAQAELEGIRGCKFDLTKSGARMTHEYFFGPQVPWLVAYTEDRDLWRHALPHSEAINAALRSYPLDFNLWDDFAKRDPESFRLEGEAIRRRERQIVEDHVRHARLENFDGTHTVPVVNATVLFSEIAGELAKGHPFGACYFDRRDGKRQWSLRSDEHGVDVSAIAKAHGGGGHPRASGFEEALHGEPVSAVR